MAYPLDNSNHQDTEPQALAAAGADAPRVVTREETNTKNPTLRNETDFYGEEPIIVPDRYNNATIKFIPQPIEQKPENIAHIDWLAFTFRGNGTHAELLSFQDILEKKFSIPPEVWEGTKSGWNGYKHRINLGPYGLLAHGGKSQRNTIHIEITGQGCALVKDWMEIYKWGKINAVLITRIDLAYDDYEGKTVNLEICKQWYHDGLFNWNGRPPKPFLYDDCATGDGSTFKIGKRKSGKELRMYEKGKEQGDPNNPWFRVELELHDKDRCLPWEMLLKPGQYFAASYKALGFLSEEQLKIKTTKKLKEMTMERSIKWVKHAAGQHINAIIQYCDGDINAAFDLIVREDIPKKLKPYFEGS